MPSRTPFDIVHTALQTCTGSRSLALRLEDGRLHEDMLLVGMFDLVVAAGAEARLVELNASSHPTAELNAPGPRPPNYLYHAAVFMQIDEQLLRLQLNYHKTMPATLSVDAFPNRELAEQSFGLEYVHWKENCEADYAPEPQGQQEWSGIINLDVFRADLTAACLRRETPHSAPRAATGPRL